MPQVPERMTSNCNKKTPIKRSGTHQGERYLSALSPDHVRVDERNTADLILFATRLSRHLKYYNANNTADGDWLPFFATDIAAILAGVSQLPVGSFQQFARGVQEFLADDPSRAPAELSSHFKLIYHLPLLLLKDTGSYFDKLPREHPLRAFIQNVLVRDMASPLEALVKYYKGALALGDPPINDVPLFDDTPLDVADYNTDFDDSDPRIQLPTVVTGRLVDSTSIASLSLSDDFTNGFAAAGWADFYTTTQADTSPYEESIGSVYDQIYDALNYNLLSTTFEQLSQALERVALEAAKYLAQSLAAFDGHTPHYGLWLAFLRLFEVNQQQINTLTQRHLEYYYKEILQLCRRGAQPDQVHLLFELNKNVQERLLPAGSTFFKAGKDAIGKEVQYQLDYDFVVNRAKVEVLKSLYRPSFKSGGAEFLLPYAAPVTNSKDGKGEALPKDNPQWQPFGPFDGIPNARIGFALADRQLFLREGNRTITIVVKLDQPFPAMIIPFAFKASLTTEDGWFESTPPAKLLVWVDTTNQLTFKIQLDGQDPAIVPYDLAVHGEGYDVVEPVVRIEFAFGQNPLLNLWAAFFLPLLRDLRFDSIQVSVKADNLRNFTLQNEVGMVDTGKPFLPFGSAPEVNAPLILGSSELFSKTLDQLTLSVEWEQVLTNSGYFLKTDPGSHEARLRHLNKGKWEGASNAYNIGLFTASSKSKDITLSGLSILSASAAQTIDNVPYSNKAEGGFIKLELEKGFGHKIYLDEKTKALINLATNTNLWTSKTTWTPTTTLYNYDAQNIPKEPYTPRINEIELGYTTVALPPARFFHLYPFGFKDESNGTDRLFPELAHEGELYLGIKDLHPPQRLALLFQTIDGSANPLKGENELQWHYLRDNTWVKIEDQFIDDKTSNLTGSGIIGIAVPEDAGTVHTVLPSGLAWFRMAVASDADALNNLLGIDAQAASATFVDQGNDPTFQSTPLPAGVISKLKVSDGAIKKISQLYASFGGKPEETNGHFYIRASERLRHKDRASTMWDYEHLILEHFPHVYKVKCISHTELCRDAQNNILADNEVKPGHVLVVTIPYVQPDSSVNKLRPFTDKKTIVAIDQFLRARISPFVQLEVQNPKIEEVQVKFQVAFTAEIADISFYKEELKRAIIRYLSPWAYGEGGEISFGGKWHKSAIINFVEEQSYVDYLKNFEMYHKADISQSDSNWPRVDEEVVEATTARSILVSHAMHIISEIS